MSIGKPPQEDQQRFWGGQCRQCAWWRKHPIWRGFWLTLILPDPCSREVPNDRNCCFNFPSASPQGPRLDCVPSLVHQKEASVSRAPSLSFSIPRANPFSFSTPSGISSGSPATSLRRGKKICAVNRSAPPLSSIDRSLPPPFSCPAATSDPRARESRPLLLPSHRPA